MKLTFAGEELGNELGFERISGFLPTGQQQIQPVEYPRAEWADDIPRGNRRHQFPFHLYLAPAATEGEALSQLSVFFTNLPSAGGLTWEEGLFTNHVENAKLLSFQGIMRNGVQVGMALNFVGGKVFSSILTPPDSDFLQMEDGTFLEMEDGKPLRTRKHMKISVTPQITELDGSEKVPVVQAGENKYTTVEQIGDRAMASILFPGLTGGGSNLDGFITAGVAVGRIYMCVVAGELGFWQLQSGTDAEASPGIIRPDDYAGGTNEKIWKQVK